jgi:GAF domain-containing protein
MSVVIEPERREQKVTWEEKLRAATGGDGKTPPASPARGMEGSQVAGLNQLGLAWELLSAAAAAVCAGLYARTQSWQALAALGLVFSAAIVCRASRLLLRRGHIDAAASVLLVASLGVPVLATLCILGATPLLAGAVLVLPVGIAALAWPGHWLSRGALPGGLGMLCSGLVDRLVPWSRLSIVETFPLALIGVGLGALGLAALLWALAQGPLGSSLSTQLLVSFLLVGTPPAAAAVAMAVAWRWLARDELYKMTHNGPVEGLVVPAASRLVARLGTTGAGLCLGSIALSVALAVRLARVLGARSPLSAARREFVGSGSGPTLAEQGAAPMVEQQPSLHTRELEQRCQHAEALVELSRVSLSLLDAQRLGRAIVDVVRDSLSLERVALYTLEPGQAWLELRAESGPDRGNGGTTGSGDGKHRIRVGDGVVGRAAADERPTIAAGFPSAGREERPLTDDRVENEGGGRDAGEWESAGTVPAQAALPLRARGRLLGVLSAQARLPEGLSGELIDVLQAMSSHVALALDNVRLLEEGQAAIDAARRVSGTLSLDAWKNVLRARTDLGFRSDTHGTERTGRVWLPRMARAEAENATVLGPREDRDRVGQTLTVPIRIHGEVIGVLDTHKPDGEGLWTSAQVALVEQIAEELSQALENARLYEETQRRGMRERQLREIATRMGGSVDLDAIMKTAVEDVAKALDVPSAFVQLYERHPSADNGSTQQVSDA